MRGKEHYNIAFNKRITKRDLTFGWKDGMFFGNLRSDIDMEEYSTMTSSRKSLLSSLIFLLLYFSSALIARSTWTDHRSDRQEGMQTAPGDSTKEPAQISPKKRGKNVEVPEYSIQVGAFARQKNADRLQQKLRAAGYRTDVYKNYLAANKLYYLVWVGSYKTEDGAKPDLLTLKEKFNIDGVIRLRSVLRQ
jgi:hypothetical protein